MTIIVQKYGGTSVGSVERMRHVVDLIMAERRAGNQVVVVVSAMAGVTNQLVKSAQQFSNAIGTAAYDFVVSTGENVSCGMLALALAERGVAAEPLAGWQLPIRTNGIHSRARVVDIEPAHVYGLLDMGVVPIITGFQGIGPDHHITTLGRGGSDTSAVEIAKALNAHRCDIYTDIDGIYTADPRIVANAHFVPNISYESAYWMAVLGAKIIHPRAVESAISSGVPLRILSSFGSDKYTSLVDRLEALDIVGISHIKDSARVAVEIASETIGQQMIDALNEQDIPIDMIHLSGDCLVFCCDMVDVSIIQKLLRLNDLESVVATPCAKVSVVGKGAAAYFNDILKILTRDSIETIAHITDEVRVSICIDLAKMERVINDLHTFFFHPTSKKVDFQPEMQ
jgi:aspartate kinase